MEQNNNSNCVDSTNTERCQWERFTFTAIGGNNSADSANSACDQALLGELLRWSAWKGSFEGDVYVLQGGTTDFSLKFVSSGKIPMDQSFKYAKLSVSMNELLPMMIDFEWCQEQRESKRPSFIDILVQKDTYRCIRSKYSLNGALRMMNSCRDDRCSFSVCVPDLSVVSLGWDDRGVFVQVMQSDPEGDKPQFFELRESGADREYSLFALLGLDHLK